MQDPCSPASSIFNKTCYTIDTQLLRVEWINTITLCLLQQLCHSYVNTTTSCSVMPEGGKSNLISIAVSYHSPFISLTPPSKTMTRERSHPEKPRFNSAAQKLESRVKHQVKEEELHPAIRTLNISVWLGNLQTASPSLSLEIKGKLEAWAGTALFSTRWAEGCLWLTHLTSLPLYWVSSFLILMTFYCTQISPLGQKVPITHTLCLPVAVTMIRHCKLVCSGISLGGKCYWI